MSADRRITPKSKRASYDDLLLELAQLAPANPAVQKIIAKHRAPRPGRPAKPKLQYRRLDAWWRPFKAFHMAKGLTEEQAFTKFWRDRGAQVVKVLEIKRTVRKSRWNAISDGKKEADKVRARRAGWQIVPAGLDQAVHGRMHRIVRDPNEAILICGVFRSVFGK
jgi:hypothetical protein